MLVLPCALCPLFMFGQWCVPVWVADGEGVTADFTDPLLAAVAPDVDDDVVDDVVDAEVDEWVVAAPATAVLTPNPTPSALAPTAVPMMILPSLDLKVPAS